MKTFLVTRAEGEGDKRAWIQFAESEQEVNEAGHSFTVVEIPISEHDSLLLNQIARIAALHNIPAVLGNLIREASKVANEEGIHLNRIQEHF